MSRRNRFLLLLIPSVSLLLQCAAGMRDRSDDLPEPPPASEESPTPGESPLEGTLAPVDVESSLIILEALVESYPGRITDLALRDGDWSILVNGQVIYWAGGRLLAADQRDNPDAYRPYSFRPNPREIPTVRDLSAGEQARLGEYINSRESRQDLRSEEFLIALWGMDGYWDSETTVIIREFLGTRIRIHPEIEESLRQVESDIMAAVETDPETAEWYGRGRTVGGYLWRDIAGSANRSLHSFGIAVDIQPRYYGDLQAYWRWTADLRDDWWAVPLSERYMFPDTVIDAFESHGFFWGGKWFLYDQIHFEYRPEIILLGEWAHPEQ